jgi:hypothetical protein
MKMNIVTFQGISDRLYNFTLYPINHSTTPQKAGIYIFLKPFNYYWQPVYIGQSHDICNRIYWDLEDHDAWECIQKTGATNVAVYEFSGTEKERIRIETDLRHKYPTACNLQ